MTAHAPAAVLTPVARLMLLCIGMSQVSDAVFRMAVAWWLLEVTQSAALFGAVIAASNVAMTATHASLGWLADRYRRGTVLTIAYGADATACALLTAAAWAGSAAPEWIAALLVLATVASTVAGPIHSSLALQASTQDSTQAFIRHRTSLSSVVMVGGPVLAGALVTAVGSKAVMLLHLVVLAGLCTMLALSARLMPPQPPNSLGIAATTGARLRLLFSGMAMLWRIRPERSLCLQSMLNNLAIAPLFAIALPVLVKDVLRLPPWSLGVCGAVFGLGALGSSLLLAQPTLARHGRYVGALAGRVLMLGGIALGVILFVLFREHGPAWQALPVIGLAMAGTGFSLVNIAVSQARALATPEACRNRLLSSSSALVTLAIPIGSAGVGGLLAAFGPTVSLTAIVAVLAVGVAVFLVEPTSRALLLLDDAALKQAYQVYLDDDVPVGAQQAAGPPGQSR
jgi:MFS family permease